MDGGRVWIEGWMDECVNKQMDGWKDGSRERLGRRMDGWMDA